MKVEAIRYKEQPMGRARKKEQWGWSSCSKNTVYLQEMTYGTQCNKMQKGGRKHPISWHHSLGCSLQIPETFTYLGHMLTVQCWMVASDRTGEADNWGLRSSWEKVPIVSHIKGTIIVGFNENGTHWLIDLNTWSPATGCLRRLVACWKRYVTEGEPEVWKSPDIHSALFLPPPGEFCLRCELSAFPSAMLLLRHEGLKSSGTMSPIKHFPL